ncbi:MAG TPA: YncE family protein [Candidatus Cybelea sp.]|nr:YncE family protein [Candidatus Cybelea sp.]
MKYAFNPRFLAAFSVAAIVASCQWLGGASAQSDPSSPNHRPRAIAAVDGMPPVINPENLYSETSATHMSPAVAGDLYRIYVPDRISGDVTVIDPVLMKVVGRFKVGVNPQHVVPAWDLQTLWVVNNAENRLNGSVTPIDPKTGKPGKSIAVDDPYNMYFTPDGKSAIVVAEESQRLDFRDPHTMELQWSLPTPGCAGINHADFSIDGRYALFTCEYGGGLVKVDLVHRQVTGYLPLSKDSLFKQSQASLTTVDANGFPVCASMGMPQDIRISPDGRTFYVADMLADGIFLVDGESFVEIGFIPTGRGTHGLYPSRDGTKLYIANRGSHRVLGARHGMGSVSVLDFATRRVVATWTIPGGGSPDMGNVSPDGRYLWLSGRFDNVVYRFDTTDGAVVEIPVGKEPHGLAVWPQPGRYSLGHTGNMR